MLLVRFTVGRSFFCGLACIISLTACGQIPNIEFTSPPTLPPPTEVLANPTDTPVFTSPTPLATPAVTETPTRTVSPSLTPSSTPTTPSSTPSTVDAAAATPGSSEIPPPTATPCFGSIVGQVFDDLNRNRQADSNEPGVMGATLFLKNSGGIFGLYTTGNGQFSFPGLVAGTYTLSETPPPGYAAEDSVSVDVTVTCGATATQNFFNVSTSATPLPTLTPTPPSTPRSTPGSFVPPQSNATGFKPFSTGPVSYIGGCGSINAPGAYYLTTSLSSRWDCIQIYSDDVIFDCQGYSLNGVDGNGYGVVVHHTSPVLGRPVRDLEIRNCNMTRHRYGIFIDAADNLYLHDNNTSGNYNDTDPRNYGIFLGLVEGGGIRVNDTRGALISDNHADGQAIGLDMRQSRGLILRGNSANGNTAWGIHLYGVTNSEISSNTSSNNIRYCTWGSGVVGAGCDAGGIMLQSGSSNNLIANNTIGGSNGNGIFIKAHGEACGDNNTIANNHIFGALYNAIELSFCRNNRLQGNEINNSLDGIWMGFALNSEIDGGNYLHDLTNHGIISWNSQDNNVSSNRIVNSREAFYFYSSDYKKEEFYFVTGLASDHISRGNCLCANTLANNSFAAFHFSNSIKNQVTNNTLTNNGTNFLMEGNTSGNIIQDNIIQGGTYDLPRIERVSFAGSGPSAWRVYDLRGRLLPREELLRALRADAPEDSFDLRWFRFKLRASLGLTAAPALDLSNWLALFGLRPAF
jgi:parallel beta-helix repeat protein